MDRSATISSEDRMSSVQSKLNFGKSFAESQSQISFNLKKKDTIRAAPFKKEKAIERPAVFQHIDPNFKRNALPDQKNSISTLLQASHSSNEKLNSKPPPGQKLHIKELGFGQINGRNSGVPTDRQGPPNALPVSKNVPRLAQLSIKKQSKSLMANGANRRLIGLNI